ncbi:MAG: hypothetical protein A3H32_12780 [Betaproteobacteria bacterium RIFCSPLOWO2_02_FULL_63_19]|nr:MAG: hypothetical protein A3H32_12780 [Betaproteobacteria bacterium RIFCSPLOWO2_02_FULL_63_19]
MEVMMVRKLLRTIGRSGRRHLMSIKATPMSASHDVRRAALGRRGSTQERCIAIDGLLSLLPGTD